MYVLILYVCTHIRLTHGNLHAAMWLVKPETDNETLLSGVPSMEEYQLKCNTKSDIKTLLV